MKATLIILFLFLSLLRCKEKNKINYEVKEHDKANFSLEYYALYPKETLRIFINNKLLYEGTENITNKRHNIWKYFYFPDTFKDIQVVTVYQGRQIINENLIDTFHVFRLNLFISPPYPKSMKQISSSPSWLPNWDYVPIDSAHRIIKLEPDTSQTWIF